MLHLGYEVWISDGRRERMPEYDVKLEGEDGKTMEFQVRWKDHNGPYANYARMKVFIDGHVAGKTRCPPGVSGKRLGIRTASADTYQPFQFSGLQTTDDDGALWPTEKLGSIEFHVVHVHQDARESAFRPARFAGTGLVHERSKKAGAHCVALGRAVRFPKARHSPVKSTPLDRKARPAAKFVFRYRPAAILHARGIMPQRAGTSSRGGNNPKARPASQMKQGRGATSADKRERKPVKPEPNARSGLGDVSGDVIDLSSDEDVPIVKHEPRQQRVLEHDPGDVIDLTLD
ncbi:hypothetical protein LXA43DRAFT_143506 [Ganoderma leucocontextum]|nr:hypothetical protein LXA43DRAFT_143506 [Ganoderma leucocontextum]